ncbi:hypothetical protein [Streptomyces profundus]|uniref:hypothetical protein n=1 Tax=Streptomyces profundus TaxID=2867410 RepID=UPI001D162C44|nr:hypothetical protein [Streptomyces sp. MA3_2.13]UED85249.1 hypothetical protein K4G22_14465 [Streptomyces sp. MA3_2.13]
MNNPAELPSTDRAEVERVLDEALRAARTATGAGPERMTRLRELVVDALPDILRTAEPQYLRFATLRDELREVQLREGATGAQPAGRAGRAGSGTLLVAFALIPVLAGVSGLVFLLLGYALRLASPEPSLAAPMRTVGWAFALVAAGGALVAAGALVVAAVRNGATSIRASGAGGSLLFERVARARADWRRALLDEGINPFLRGELADTWPADGRASQPRYSSPQFSSPEFSSPANERKRAGGGPAVGHPDFASPDFTGPSEGGADRG